MGNNPPFYFQSNYPAVSFAVLNPTASQLSKGLPLNALHNPAAPSLFSLDPSFRNPYFQHWNFGIQRELGFSTVWDISYAGLRPPGGVCETPKTALGRALPPVLEKSVLAVIV
jgi:hypothetical protein